MNFNAENQSENQKLQLSKKSALSKKDILNKEIEVVSNDFGTFFKIMVFVALLAIILLCAGASLCKYKESFTAFGSSSIKPIYNKTYKSYSQNMYNQKWTFPCIICMAITVVVCVLMVIRRKKYPNTLDYAIFSLSIVPTIIFIFSGIIIVPSSKRETAGKPGVLTGHASYDSNITFAFVVVVICFIIFALGVYLILKDKKENSYIKE